MQLLFVITTIIITNKLLDAINYLNLLTSLFITHADIHLCFFVCVKIYSCFLSNQSLSRSRLNAHNVPIIYLRVDRTVCWKLLQLMWIMSYRCWPHFSYFPFSFFPTCPWHANSSYLSLAVPCWWRFSMIMLFFSMYLSLILQWWPDDCNNIPLITLLL